jgi:hypothetical protein
MGSFARKTARPDSDVDVAVLFGRPFGPEDVLELKGRLENLLERDVDLVVLDLAVVQEWQAAARGQDGAVAFRDRNSNRGGGTAGIWRGFICPGVVI